MFLEDSIKQNGQSCEGGVVESEVEVAEEGLHGKMEGWMNEWKDE